MSEEAYIDHYIPPLDEEHRWTENKKTVEDPRLLSVSTGAAGYHLHPAFHSQETDIDDEVLAGMDGIVLESGSARFEDWTLADFAEHDQLTGLMEKNLTAYELPIYSVDVPAAEDTVIDRHLPTDDIFAKAAIRFAALDGVPGGIGLLGLLHGHPEAAPLLLPGILNALPRRLPLRGQVNTAVSYLRLGSFYNPTSGGRSAFTAEKLDDHLAPYLADDLGRKPQLLIEYGAAHLDIAPYLKHEKLRDYVLTLHQTLGHPWLQEEYKNKVLEYRFNDFLDGDTETYPDFDDLAYQKIIHEFDDSD